MCNDWVNMRKILLIAVVLFVFNSKTAGAVNSIPSNVEAGVIDSALQTNIQKNNEPKQEVNDFKLNVKSDDNSQSNLKSPPFLLKKVVFEGNTQVNNAELEKFFESVINTKVQLQDITKIVLKITELYNSKGYAATMAYIPPQKIVDGTLVIRIIEGKLGEIKVTGNKWAKDAYFKTIVFKGNGVKPNSVIKISSINNSINEINNQEYLKGEVVFEKGKEKETTDITLKIDEKLPVGFNVGWSNQGRELVGIQQVNLTATNYNLTGFGDLLTNTTSLASGTVGNSTYYSVPVSPWKTKLNLLYSYSGADLGGEYEILDIKSSSNLYSISLSQPILNNNRFNVQSELGFDFREGKSSILDTTVRKYQLRALRTGFSVIENDKTGRWINSNQVSVGLPIFSGDNPSTRSIGGSQFVKLNMALARVQSLPLNSFGIFRISGQYANRALLAVEQMQLGGMYSVRGFEEGSVMGDCGYNLSLELRKSIPYLPKNVNIPYWKGKSLSIPLKNRIQFAAFYDNGYTGQIFNHTKLSYRSFLQSIGAGLRVNLTKFLTASFDLGVPLGRKRYDGQDGIKFHFAITSNILPLPFKNQKL